ncbi:MAG: GNAT family N-acetyltransferase [Cyanobacteriota bacterium]|nr:GNAT family N-acetyltransferase [Cyanobacteriota bacterium]
MTDSQIPASPLEIRPLQYRDLEVVEALAAKSCEADPNLCSLTLGRQLQQVRRWYGLLKFLSLFPNPRQHFFSAYVAEQNQRVSGMVQVSPFNSTRSTWRVDRIMVEEATEDTPISPLETGNQLLRHCFETIIEARTWLLEVNVNHEKALAVYRQNGFQPLAQLTYWAIAPEQLQALAEREPNLANLLPISNADAKLLCQLDTVSMPPLLRQVFDRHINDFKHSIFDKVGTYLDKWTGRAQLVQGYVFEPQRKAAIGYFRVEGCKDGTRPHQARVTVHPAYTWLYAELFAHMARVVQELPPQSLQLVSADYQPEREEYLEKFGAERIEHSLLMSRSVWHKIREAKPLEALQLSEMLQGLQPRRTPVPTRISWFNSALSAQRDRATQPESNNGSGKKESSQKPPKSQA